MEKILDIFWTVIVCTWLLAPVALLLRDAFNGERDAAK